MPCRIASRGSTRPALGEISANGSKKRQRAPQTTYGCANETCIGLRACKKARCWDELHSTPVREALRQEEVKRRKLNEQGKKAAY